MAIIRSIKGFTMPKPWSSKGFMAEVRAKVPAYAKKQVNIKLKGYGTTKLSTVEGVNMQATGVFDFDPNNQYSISTANADFFVSRNPDEASKEKFPFILNPAFRSLFITLPKDETRVVGTASEDTRVFKTAFGPQFPEWAFAITYLGENRFDLNCVEANPLSFNIKLGRVDLNKTQKDEIISQNAVKLRQLIEKPEDFRNALNGKYFYGVADPNGALEMFVPKTSLRPNAFSGLAVKFEYGGGLVVRLSGHQQFESLYLEGEPDYVKEILERSATRARSVDVAAEALKGDLKISR